MKVLQINTVVNSGSTGRIAEDIGKTLIDSGYESCIAYGRGDRPSASKLFKIGNSKDIYAHYFKTLLFDQHGLGSKKSTLKLLEHIRRINPDLIHLHNIHGYYINYQLLFEFLNKTKIKLVWTLHDSWSYTGHCSFYESVNCEKWKIECSNCPKTKMYPKSIYLDNSKSNFNLKKNLFSKSNAVIVTPSKWLAKEVSGSFLKNLSCRVINNGLNLEVFKSSFFNFKPVNKKKVVLGVASIWDERKGLKDFIKLSNLIKQEFIVVLIGLNDKQIKSLPNHIKGIKRTENIDELVSWYQNAFVFFNPTYQDNFPTTNIEALACGTPVITYETGGSPEAVDSKTGFVLLKGAYNLVPEILKEIDGNYHNYSLFARQRAEKLFNKNDRYQDYINLYQDLIYG